MYHEIVIVGNLGRDPEMRYTPDGTPVTNFSVATNRKYSRADGSQVTETIWFRVTAWRKLAEAVNQYLAKGRQVLVIGRLNADESGNPRVFERSDGTSGASYEVTANTIKFLGSAGNGGGEEAHEESGVPNEDEIPF